MIDYHDLYVQSDTLLLADVFENFRNKCLKNCPLMVLNGKNKNMLKFNKEFIKNYDEDSDKGYILEIDVKYPKNLLDLHSDLPFLQ